MSETSAAETSRDADLLEEIRKNRERAEDGDSDNREEMEDDLRFAAGDHWPEADRQQRDEDGRPWLTLNQVPQFIRQVTGDIRLNRPAIKVRPVDSGADVDLAEVFTGLIRHIEAASHATSAYVTAAESSARCGIGHFRIVTEFLPDSFEQEIRIRPIDNPFAVLWDPMSQEPTRSDANYCFVDTEMQIDAFKEEYPNASTSEFETEHVETNLIRWFTRDTVTVSEYWRKEKVTKTIGLTEGGEVVDLTDIAEKDRDREYKKRGIVRTRDVETHQVRQYITNGAEILEGPYDWPGRHIPIVPVLGEEVHLGEKVVRYGLVRFLKDPQRLYNYWHTMMAETIALAPKAPYLVTPDEISGYEDDWEDANKRALPFLLFKPDPATGGRPQRQTPVEPPIAAIQGMAAAREDMSHTTGIHPASLGAQSNEVSGRAILARERQGDVGTFVFIDNLARAIAYGGEILVDIVPKFYDTQRIVRILGEDDSEEIVEINRVVGEDEDGNPVLENDITVGKYDVVVETGPSFSTKRQEAAESMVEFMRVNPTGGALIADLLVKNLDWPQSQEIAERLKKTLPPGFDEDGPPQPQGPTPEQQIELAKANAEQATAQAEIAKIQAGIGKTVAETEGQELENMQKTLELAMQSGRFQEQVAAMIGEELARQQNAREALNGPLVP